MLEYKSGHIADHITTILSLKEGVTVLVKGQKSQLVPECSSRFFFLELETTFKMAFFLISIYFCLFFFRKMSSYYLGELKSFLVFR